MRRQMQEMQESVLAQMQEQIKTPKKELNKREISNLPDAEFKPLVIRTLKQLSEDLSNIKKIQSETKDALIEIKNNLQGNSKRVDEAENQITDLEHKEAKYNQSEQQEEKIIQKNEDGVSSLWDNCQHSNSHIVGVPEEKRKSKKLEIYLKK